MKKYIKRIVKSILGMPDYSILDTLPLINYQMDAHGIEYKPRSERDTFNIEIKLERLAQGGLFEMPEMVAENNVIGKYFIRDAQTVVDIGSGVATFENIHANNFPDVEFTASDYDIKSISWCKENRPFKNVTYVTSSIDELLSQHGKYDLAITVDVIEHLEDYKSFAQVGYGRLFIFGGNKLFVLKVYNGQYTLKEVEDDEDTYIPVTTIGITEADSAVNEQQILDDVNMMSQWRRNKLVSGTYVDDGVSLRTTRFTDYQLDTSIKPKKETDINNIEITISSLKEIAKESE